MNTLERYAGISSIARRSYYLLYHSAERLISAHHSQPTNRRYDMGESTAEVSRSQQRRDNDFEQRLNTSLVRTTVTVPKVHGTQAMNRVPQNPSRKSNNGPFELPEYSSGVASFLDSNLDLGFPPELDVSPWTGNLDPPNWSLMPSVDHLETLAPRFDFQYD